MSHKDHLETLIAEGNLAQAIKELLEATKLNGQKELNHSIILQSSSFNQIEKARRDDTISFDNYTIAKNKIKAALLHYIEEEYEESEKYIWKKQEQNSFTEKPIISNVILIKLLDAAFDNNGLQLFCMMYFEDVYRNFTDTQPKNTKIMALIDYCKQHVKIQELLNAIKEERPEMYNQIVK